MYTVFFPSHLLSSRFCSLSLLLVTQIRGHIAGPFPPLPTTVRAFYFYFEKTSALFSLVDWRRITPTYARRSQQLIPFLCKINRNLTTAGFDLQDQRYRLGQVKRRKSIPWSKSTPFSRVRPWIIAHFFYEPLWRTDLFFLFVCFLYDFSSAYTKYHLGNLDLLRRNIFGEKKNGGPASEWTYRTRVQPFGVLFPKNGVDIRSFVRKTCEFA